MDKIYDTTPANLSDLLTNSDDHFIKDLGYRVSLKWDVWEATLFIEDLANALVRGKSCISFSVAFKNDAHGDATGINRMMSFLEKFGQGAEALKSVFAHLSTLSWQVGPYSAPPIALDGGANASYHSTPGVRTYSPFATVTALKKGPARWTVWDVVRALWNGQFKDLRCRGYYTDDYAADAAANFRIGEIAKGREFARRLIEHPSGWWASQDKGSMTVSICCHTFDCNDFVLVLDPAGAVEAAKTEPAEAAMVPATA